MGKLLLFFVITCCFFSCKKENSPKWTEFNVSATNRFTQTPFNDANFYVHEARNVQPFKVNSIANMPLINGEVQIGFKAKNSLWRYSYKLDYDFEKYWILQENDSGIEIETGITYNLNFELVEMGHWVFEVTNQSCEAWSDYVTIEIVSEYEILGLRSFSFDAETATGCLINAALFERTVPAGYYYIYYESNKLSGTTSSIDTVLVQPNTTTNYNLMF